MSFTYAITEFDHFEHLTPISRELFLTVLKFFYLVAENILLYIATKAPILLVHLMF